MKIPSALPLTMLSASAGFRFALGVSVATVLGAPSVHAAIYTKANNTTNLTTGGSFLEVGAPTTAADFVTFDFNYAGAAIGNTGAMTLGGFLVTDTAANVAFGFSSTNTVTVGNGTINGVQTLIDMSSVSNGTNNLTINGGNNNFRVTGGSGSTSVLNVGTGRALTFNTKITAQGNNKKLEMQGAGDVIFNGAFVTGAQPLGFNVNGANVTLNAANTFALGTGAFAVTSGTLNLGNDGALGGVGTVVFNGGNIQPVGAARTITQAFTLGGDVNFGGAFDLSLSGTITGATRRVNYNGGQTLTLTGAGSNFGAISVFAGTAVIDTGGNVTNSNFTQVGPGAGQTGAMIVKGTGAYTSNGDFNVGDSGDAVTAANGTLTVQDTAAVTIGAAGGLYLGAAFFAGTTLANGTLNQTGGTVTHNNATAGTFVIGGRNGALATGLYNLSAGTTTSSGQVYVGGEGTGTLNVSGAGQFNANAGLRLANGAAAIGTVNLNGGTVSATTISKGAGTGTFYFNGGTLRALANTTTFITGLTALNVKASGALVDTNNFNVTIGQPLLEDGASPGGALSKSGLGTLTLALGGNTYTGATNVAGGTLLVSSAGNTQSNLIGTGALNLLNGGRFRFNSTSASTLNSALDVGPGGGTISIRGGTTFSPTALTGSGALTLDIDNGVTLSPTTFQGWNGAVNVSTTGAGATFRLLGAFDNTSLGNAALDLGPGISLTRNAGTNSAITTSIGTLSGAAGSFLGGSLTGSGTFTFSIGSRSENATFAGAVVDGSTRTALTKVGNGTQILSGTNTYTGATTISSGTVDLSGSISGTTGVNLTGGAVVLSGALEAINNAAPLTLSAGTTLAFATGLSNRTETVDSLSLLGNTVIDFGSGTTNQFAFTNGITGLGTFTLSIHHWTGPVGDGAQDVLALSNPLSATELGNISFYSDAGTVGGFLGTGAEISFAGPGPAFQIVPVPEPSSAVLLGVAGLLRLVGYRGRRRQITQLD